MSSSLHKATNRAACLILLVAGLMTGSATAQDTKTASIQEQLLQAVRDGEVQRVRELLAAGASLTAPETQYTPLHWAAERSQLAVVRVLVEAGADVNAENFLDGTPLHKAGIRGPKELVQLLLQAGADVTITSTRNGTPLHAAAAAGQAEIAAMLLQAGAEVHAAHWGMTPLMRAAKYGQDEVIGVLLAMGADPAPALYWSPTGTVAQRLIDAGADPNALNDEGQSPLHLTPGRFWGPREGAVSVIIQAGGKINARDQNGWMPLHAAAQQALPGVVEILIAAGADINARDGNGNTPFSLVEHDGNKLIVQILTDAGAEDGLSPFLRAAAKGERDEIARLIAAGEDVDQTGPQRKTALHLATANNHTEVVLALVAAKANVRLANEAMLTPLHFAQNKRVAVALLDAGAELAPNGASYASPLFLAATEGRRDVVEVLLDRGGKVVPKGLIQWVTYAGRVSVLKLLLNKGADPNERLSGDMFDDGETPLIIATRGGIADMSCPEYVTNEIRLKLAQVLLEAGADVTKKSGIGFFDDFTALHGAARLGDKDIVQLLIRKQADINATGSGGYFGGLTPLHEAVEGNHLKVVELLINAGANVNAKTSNSLNGNSTPLDLAETAEMRTLLKKAGGTAAENNP